MKKVEQEPFINLCRGKCETAILHHKNAIEYHQMMLKFYSLQVWQQKIFISAFNQLVEQQENGKSAPKN